MLCFSLGTLPAMFVLGAAGTLFGRRVQRGLMRAGALVVVLLGLLLVQRGLNLGGLPTGNGQTGSVLSMTTSTAAAPGSGNPSDPSGTDAATPQPVGTTDADGFQRVMGEVSRGAYPSVTVKKGIPVRLNLHAASGTITGCNRTVVFPEYGIEQALNPGDNTVEFTPDKTGTIGYTCWMGMVSGSITVVE